MKSLRFVSLFAVVTLAVLLVVLVAAQSNPMARASQSNGLPDAQNPPAAPASPRPASVYTPHPVKFAKAADYDGDGYRAVAVAIGDLNGDGHPDIVLVNTALFFGTAHGELSVLMGNGDGTFQDAAPYDSGGYGATSVAIADVNGDGHLDLVVANDCQTFNQLSQCNSLGGVSVLLGNGDGTFQPAVLYDSGGFDATSVAVVDVNGDGHPDLIVANQCQTFDQNGECVGPSQVGVLFGNGDGTFQPAVSYGSIGTDASSVAVGDVNGDGAPDLVVQGSVTSVLLGNGDGTFQTPVNYSLGGQSIALGDLNGDGYPDVVVANGQVNVMLNSGDGTFQAPVIYNPGVEHASWVAIGDVNGGALDIVTASSFQDKQHPAGGVGVLPGNGDGTFQPAASFGTGGRFTDSVAIGDVNGDGKADIVTANGYGKKSTSSSVGVLLNDYTADTSTYLSGLPQPAQINQTVTFTATVKSNPPVANGMVVTFREGKTTLGAGTTNNGVATFSTSFSKAETYTIKATGAGVIFHKSSTGTAMETVNP
jgi:hypothetical protein